MSDEYQYPPDHPLAVLAAEEAELRAAGVYVPAVPVTPLERDHDTVPGTTASYPAEEFEEPSSGPLPMNPVWAHLAEDAADDQMALLCQWVVHVVRRYELESQVPQCWAHHPWAVDAFTALYEWWREVFFAPADSAKRGYDLDAWLTALASRTRELQERVDGCLAFHQEPAPVKWVPDVEFRLDVVQSKEAPPLPQFSSPAG